MIHNSDRFPESRILSFTIGLILIFILLVVFFLYCKGDYKFSITKKSVVEEQTATTVIDHAANDARNVVENKETDEINRFTGRKQVVLHKVGVPILLQNPKFPTGCEAMSLMMVLQYYGFDISDDDMVDEYLRTWSDDYQVGFRGDPRSPDGGMMWPPALVDTANDYLASQSTNRKASDVSGTDFDTLIRYIDNNIPIIIWVTETFTDNLQFDDMVYEYNGQEYHSHYGSHCVVITGYNEINNTITINNPQNGEESIEKYQLWSVYDACGRCAVIIS